MRIKCVSIIRSLEKCEGPLRLVAAVMAEKVLQQYEEVLSSAGYNPALIDFHCLQPLQLLSPAP